MSFLLGALQLFACALGFRHQLRIVFIEHLERIPGGGKLLEGRGAQDHIDEAGVARTVHVTRTGSQLFLVAFDFLGFLVYLFLSFFYLLFGSLLLIDGSIVIVRSLIELILHLVELVERLLSLCLLFGGGRIGHGHGGRNGQTSGKDNGHCGRGKCSLMFCD